MHVRAVIFDLDDTLFPQRRILGELAASLGIGGCPNSLRELHAGLGDQAPPLAALRRQLLARLRPDPQRNERLADLACCIPVAIATNGGPGQREKIRRLGLAGVIRQVFVSGELGARKPDPAFFAPVLAWANLPACHCLFVGDDPVCDIAGAQRAGLRTAWIDSGDRAPPSPAPDLAAATIEDLLPLIEPC